VPEHWTVDSLRRHLRPLDMIKIGLFGSHLKLDEIIRSVVIRDIDLPVASDADVPEEYSDLLNSEAVMDDEELQEEIPAESD